MPFVLERRVHFSAAHRLHAPGLSDDENREIYGKCNNPHGHGHNYVWRVRLRGELDERTGMLYNLADLKVEMARVTELVDHRNLDKDVAYFKDNVSTSENVARFLYNELKSVMKRPEILHEVVLEETENNIFVYSER